MNLTFEQAAGGCDKDVLVNVADTCPRCLGNKAEPGTHKVQCHHCGGTGMVTDVLLCLFFLNDFYMNTVFLCFALGGLRGCKN